MIKGLMDHWVPTKEHISKFWKTDIETIKRDIDCLKNDIDFNNFTFYTKWYTNGVKSNLDFLRNYTETQNFKTDNVWGNQIIDYLHGKDITVGAMLQLLTFECNLWEKELSLGEWNVKTVAETEFLCYIADFSNSTYIYRLKEIIMEHLIKFPDLDFMFFEFEGLSLEMIKKVYRNWAIRNNKPDEDHVSYDEATLKYCKAIDMSVNLLWSNEGREMLKAYFKGIFKIIHELLKEFNYKGRAGVVYHMYGYEAFVYPGIMPDNGWLLLPWWYWVFESASTPIEIVNTRKQMSKNLLKEWKDKNHPICYIGDVALGKNGLESIKEFYDYCINIGVEGYLGMGNPEPERGLRWLNVDDETVLAARNLYKSLY